MAELPEHTRLLELERSVLSDIKDFGESGADPQKQPQRLEATIQTKLSQIRALTRDLELLVEELAVERITLIVNGGSLVGLAVVVLQETLQLQQQVALELQVKEMLVALAHTQILAVAVVALVQQVGIRAQELAAQVARDHQTVLQALQ